MEEITHYTSSITSKRPILFIDGMNNFIRHYVVNETMNAHGDMYGGALGFLRTLRILSKTFNPSRMIIFWEQGGPCPRRKKLCPEYKANRTKMKDFNGMYKNERDELLMDKENKTKQLSFLTKAINQLPVCQVYVPECEGDDVLAYGLKRTFYNHEGYKVIVSGDKDFYQLLEDPNVRVFSPIKKTLVNGEDVLEEFGISPRNFCLAKSLVGDTSDNISGVPGIKFKTAAKRWPFLADKDVDHTVDDLVAHAKEQIADKGTKTLKCYTDVVANEEIIHRNWQLMYLDTSALSASQIDKINFRINEFKPASNHLEFIKTFVGHDLPVTTDMNSLPSDLRFLTILS
jgi:5'-3' exonuclease